MKVYDVGIGWANPVDQKFVEELKPVLRKKGLSWFEITFHNLASVFERVVGETLHFRNFLDRSSDDHPAYFLLAEVLRSRGARVVNNPYQMVRFASKTTLHRLFEQQGLPVLPTTILSGSRYSKKELEHILTSFSVPFVIKPAHGGAGEGVVMSGKNVKDVVQFLKDNVPDDGLIQSYITPSQFEGKVTWFRPIYVCGTTIPLWWDPKNMFYHVFGDSPYERKIAKRLEKIIQKVAALTHIELFSMEAVITHDKKLVIVDYLNYPIDLNTREEVPDGLPPETLKQVVVSLSNSIAKHRNDNTLK